MLPDGSWSGVDGDFWYRVEADRPAVAGHGVAHGERGGVQRGERGAPAADSRRDVAMESVQIQGNGAKADFEQLFRLDWDAAEIEAKLLDLAPEMAPYIAAFPGLRIMRPSCSTESFFCFLCTPNNNLTRIVQMARHLATYGPVIDTVDGMPVHRFPEVATIAAIPEGELRARAFGYRAATITSIARQVAEKGDGWIESLKFVPYEEAHAELCALKGIGPKLADCIALFALHHTEAVPIDTHIWQAFVRLYRPEWKGKALTDARYREAAQFLRARFGPLGGWAQQYLFYDNMLNWRTRKP